VHLLVFILNNKMHGELKLKILTRTLEGKHDVAGSEVHTAGFIKDRR
jgi:hypothetical protein